MESIALNLDELAKLKKILSENGVSKAFLFGSVVTKNFDPDKSDLDILVDLEEKDPLKRGEKLLSIWDEIEFALGRRVDLVTLQSLKNPILKKVIHNSKVLCYDREGEKMDA